MVTFFDFCGSKKIFLVDLKEGALVWKASSGSDNLSGVYKMSMGKADVHKTMGG